MPSLFYRAHFQPYPVTLLLLEHISFILEEQQALPEEEQDTFEDVARKAIKETGALPPERIATEEELVYLFGRLKQIQDEHTSKPATGSARNKEKTFGANFMQWLEELDSEKLCLFASDYDYTRAVELYSKTDRDVVVEIARQRAEAYWQDKLAGFEACLFGFGGGYGDSNSNEIDLRENPEQVESSIRAMGF